MRPSRRAPFGRRLAIDDGVGGREQVVDDLGDVARPAGPDVDDLAGDPFQVRERALEGLRIAAEHDLERDLLV